MAPPPAPYTLVFADLSTLTCKALGPLPGNTGPNLFFQFEGVDNVGAPASDAESWYNDHAEADIFTVGKSALNQVKAFFTDTASIQGNTLFNVKANTLGKGTFYGLGLSPDGSFMALGTTFNASGLLSDINNLSGGNTIFINAAFVDVYYASPLF